MCGISGIISLNKSELNNQDSKDLDIMLDSMYHRGPDGEGKKLFPNNYFGMRRLAIIDLEGGQQPISNENGDVWVVMNGEIYNYIELKRELIKQGHNFKTSTDTEVIVHLYEEYGKDFVKMLNGMFAIYLYDEKTNTQFIFRDHMGIKPLFYGIKNEKFLFSSDLNGLSSIMNSKLSRESLLSYLGLSYIPKPNTIYEGIYKLMPGSAIMISHTRPPLFYTFWQLSNKINFDISFNESADKLTELMKESNAIQLRSDTDFAISLSGGIDSSAVLGFASEASSKTLNTISMGYEGKNNSLDINYAELMAKRYKTNHFSINLNREHYFDYIDEIIKIIDEPIADSALIPNYIISKEAKKRGIKVLLSGAGGDELFGGYKRHFAPSLFSARGLTRFPSILRAPGYLLSNLFEPLRNNEKLKYPYLSFSSEINGLNYSFLSKIMSEGNYKNILNGVRDHYNDLNDSQKEYSKSRMLNDTKNYLVDNILSLSDKSSMAASVEGRFPLIDYRIVEFAFSLPAKYTISEKFPKSLLRKVSKNYIANEILNRKKEGFNAPIQQWLGKSQASEILKYVQIGIKEHLADLINPVEFEKILSNKNVFETSFENIYNLYFLIKWLKSHDK